MRILPEETGAVVIDMQEKLMMAMNETKACEEKAAMLLKGLRCCRFRRDRSAVYKGTGPHIAVTL